MLCSFYTLCLFKLLWLGSWFESLWKSQYLFCLIGLVHFFDHRCWDDKFLDTENKPRQQNRYDNYVSQEEIWWKGNMRSRGEMQIVVGSNFSTFFLKIHVWPSFIMCVCSCVNDLPCTLKFTDEMMLFCYTVWLDVLFIIITGR